jgi:hypothetical protein
LSITCDTPAGELITATEEICRNATEGLRTYDVAVALFYKGRRTPKRITSVEAGLAHWACEASAHIRDIGLGFVYCG